METQQLLGPLQTWADFDDDCEENGRTIIGLEDFTPIVCTCANKNAAQEIAFINLFLAAPDMHAALIEAENALEAMQTQIEQMQGLFPDEDGTIQAALDSGETSQALAKTALAKAEGRAS